jgi:hypothetical protein
MDTPAVKRWDVWGIEISRLLVGYRQHGKGVGMIRFTKFNKYIYVLALIAIVGGIALFIVEALMLQPVAIGLPGGYVGDIWAWALLIVDMWIVGYVAYRLGFKRYVLRPKVNDVQQNEQNPVPARAGP